MSHTTHSNDDSTDLADDIRSLSLSDTASPSDPRTSAESRQSQDDLDHFFDESTASSSITQSEAERVAAESQTAPSEFQHIFDQFSHAGDDTSAAAAESDRASVVSGNSSSRKLSIAEMQKSINQTKSQHFTPDMARFDFHQFLEQMKQPSAAPIKRYTKEFVQAFDRRAWTVDEQIKLVQDYLEFVQDKMKTCEVFKEMSEQEFENAKEGMEKLVMNRLYPKIFSPSTTDDKERDAALQHKIGTLRWIKEKHLDIPKTSHNKSFINFAVSELLKINRYKSPRDKLICFLNSCKVIYGLIRCIDVDAGADLFFPLLVHVIIRANPPQLVSNMEYIFRFRNPEHLQSEAGYYLTNLMGAISFIETLDDTSLTITKEEYDRNVQEAIEEMKQEANEADKETAEEPDRGKRHRLGRLFFGRNEPPPESEMEKRFQDHRTQHYEKQKTGTTDLPVTTPPSEPSTTPNTPTQASEKEKAKQEHFDRMLKTTVAMFPNIEPGVCYMILQANEGRITETIDTLLEMSEP
ncbi:uncharacterized protein BYT42DRAFT_588718 [Radiomyces spectabilis]|uniref:uncharacterized protein n=1 Tax=Radiomyces spectabilis TaxID=64574 RepID=UPI00221E8C7E|nr:uncharacterized protein BYT42DRAFT_588718 [Radiomyces spectabilis]KAI8366050.1 hypothetical protein BYT42DRAFT_588718 [Radiomyces spectabilis]